MISVNPSSDSGSFGVVRPVAYKSVCASYRDSLGVSQSRYERWDCGVC